MVHDAEPHPGERRPVFDRLVLEEVRGSDRIVTLSDHVLVMSQRPGRIIDEIEVALPQRDNPLARRKDAKVQGYVARLMDRLDIGPNADHDAPRAVGQEPG